MELERAVIVLVPAQRVVRDGGFVERGEALDALLLEASDAIDLGEQRVAVLQALGGRQRAPIRVLLTAGAGAGASGRRSGRLDEEGELRSCVGRGGGGDCATASHAPHLSEDSRRRKDTTMS